MHPGIRACLLITTLYKSIRIFLTKIQQKTCLNHPQNSYLSSRALSEPTDILRMCVYIFRNCDAKWDIVPYPSYNTRYPQKSPKSHFLLKKNWLFTCLFLRRQGLVVCAHICSKSSSPILTPIDLKWLHGGVCRNEL